MWQTQEPMAKLIAVQSVKGNVQTVLASIFSTNMFEGNCNILIIPNNNLYDRARFMKLYVSDR